jgi:adenylate kinase family enzyme
LINQEFLSNDFLEIIKKGVIMLVKKKNRRMFKFNREAILEDFPRMIDFAEYYKVTKSYIDLFPEGTNRHIKTPSKYLIEIIEKKYDCNAEKSPADKITEKDGIFKVPQESIDVLNIPEEVAKSIFNIENNVIVTKKRRINEK